jgi:hypothetical protein
VAALWIAATGASFLYWSVTGRQEPLDWCRSGGALTGAAALAALAALAASLLNGVAEGPLRFGGRKRTREPLHPGLPCPSLSWLDAMDRAVTDR